MDQPSPQGNAVRGPSQPDDLRNYTAGQTWGQIANALKSGWNHVALFTKSIRTGSTSGLSSLDGRNGTIISGGTQAAFIFGDQSSPNTAWGAWARIGNNLFLTSSEAGTLLSVDRLTGQIAQGAWTAPTLVNSWANFGLSHLAAGYRQDLFGRVWLRGFLTGGTTNTTAFTLPAGMRPSGFHEFSGAYFNGTVWMTYAGYVDSSGNVVPQQTSAAGTGIGIATSFDTL